MSSPRKKQKKKVEDHYLEKGSSGVRERGRWKNSDGGGAPERKKRPLRGKTDAPPRRRKSNLGGKTLNPDGRTRKTLISPGGWKRHQVGKDKHWVGENTAEHWLLEEEKKESAIRQKRGSVPKQRG